MKLKQFLKEQNLFEISSENLDKIKHDCSEFIKESGGLPAFRGVSNQPKLYTKTKPFSYARDSNNFLTNTFNLFIEQKFKYKGIRTNNRIYCAGDAPQLKQYGDLYYVFPVNGYKFVWSYRVQDATNDIQLNEILDSMMAHLKENEPDKSEELYDSYLKSIKNKAYITLSDFKQEGFGKTIMMAIEEAYHDFDYQNTELVEGLKTGHEIIFQTDGYYSIAVIGNPDETEEGEEFAYEPPYKYWANARKNYRDIYSFLK